MHPIAYQSFFEEFTKIAESFERSGRRPISVDRLLERESEDWEEKTSAMPPKMPPPMPPKTASAKRDLTAAIAGAAAFELARRANQDRKMGRMVRRQQQVSGY